MVQKAYLHAIYQRGKPLKLLNPCLQYSDGNQAEENEVHENPADEGNMFLNPEASACFLNILLAMFKFSLIANEYLS